MSCSTEDGGVAALVRMVPATGGACACALTESHTPRLRPRQMMSGELQQPRRSSNRRRGLTGLSSGVRPSRGVPSSVASGMPRSLPTRRDLQSCTAIASSVFAHDARHRPEQARIRTNTLLWTNCFLYPTTPLVCWPRPEFRLEAPQISFINSPDSGPNLPENSSVFLRMKCTNFKNRGGMQQTGDQADCSD